jgi:hypothetical protein
LTLRTIGRTLSYVIQLAGSGGDLQLAHQHGLAAANGAAATADAAH